MKATWSAALEHLMMPAMADKDPYQGLVPLMPHLTEKEEKKFIHNIYTSMQHKFKKLVEGDTTYRIAYEKRADGWYFGVVPAKPSSFDKVMEIYSEQNVRTDLVST